MFYLHLADAAVLCVPVDEFCVDTMHRQACMTGSLGPAVKSDIRFQRWCLASSAALDMQCRVSWQLGIIRARLWCLSLLQRQNAFPVEGLHRTESDCEKVQQLEPLHTRVPQHTTDRTLIPYN